MVGINIDPRKLREWSAEKHDKVDYEKVLSAWSKEVTGSLARTHGRRYSYSTPAVSARTKLRRRNGRLLTAIKTSTAIKKMTKDSFIVEFDYDIMRRIAPYIEYHINYDINGKESFTYLVPKLPGEKIFIPLSRALDGDGNLAVDPPYIAKLVQGRPRLLIFWR